MGRLILIDALAAVAVLAIWYYWLARYNRRKGAATLRWVESACSGRGGIVEARWLDRCRLQARLGFDSHWFENARVTVRLRPRPMPVEWLLSYWRKQRETVTFEADLDCAPGFHLEVVRHRWLTQKHTHIARRSKNWAVLRPGPVVLTTRTRWTQELTPVVNALMTSPGHNLISVRFRPTSPHLAATVALDALSDEHAAASFLGVVRDLAAGASAHRQ
ncbi:MAG: hypothetical protein LAO03_21805 [Acidobacteriia bacterium]|nr:hypothetical protein [Terriglobia bacterium]